MSKALVSQIDEFYALYHEELDNYYHKLTIHEI